MSDEKKSEMMREFAANNISDFKITETGNGNK